MYCDFELPEVYLDTVQRLAIYVNGCEPPIFEHPRVSIFAPEEPLPICTADLGEEACNAAGGTYVCVTACTCRCP